MRLKKIFIDNFKNLKNFTIDFNQNSYWDIIIGKNGSGKSNLFEAILEIFQFLQEGEIIRFEFSIEYTINKNPILIELKKGKIFLNKKQVKKIQKKFLPDNILIYYSGHNLRIANLISSYEDKYTKNIKKLEIDELRFIFGINGFHKNIFLLLLLISNPDNIIKRRLISQLEISEFDSEIEFIFKRPNFSVTGPGAWDLNPYWGIKGYLKEFLEQLEQNKFEVDPRKGNDGYFADKDLYYLHINLNKFKKIASNYPSIKLFQYLDDLRIIDMIGEINFDIKFLSDENINSHDLSDGEIQCILFNGIIHIFKHQNCITLLDEPDAFLHPEWQSYLISNLEKNPTEIQNNHILITSHQPSTVAFSNDDEITIIEKKKPFRCFNANKEYAVKELSGGLVLLNHQEQILNILCKIKENDKPILFTEGYTDTIIVETAWRKLKNSPIPFNTIYAFNCGFLRQLIQDNKIYNEMNNKPLFGLFDFDNAYNDWKGIKGEIIQDNPLTGMIKKIKNKKGFAFLLPIPKNTKIRSQVIKNEKTNETYLHESKLSIELLFFGAEQTKDFFREERCIGGGKKIVFKGAKDKFANNIIPSLPEDAFRVFSPIFEFMESVIEN